VPGDHRSQITAATRTGQARWMLARSAYRVATSRLFEAVEATFHDVSVR
jgi:hypothetical protein